MSNWHFLFYIIQLWIYECIMHTLLHVVCVCVWSLSMNFKIIICTTFSKPIIKCIVGIVLTDSLYLTYQSIFLSILLTGVRDSSDPRGCVAALTPTDCPHIWLCACCPTTTTAGKWEQQWGVGVVRAVGGWRLSHHTLHTRTPPPSRPLLDHMLVSDVK